VDDRVSVSVCSLLLHSTECYLYLSICRSITITITVPISIHVHGATFLLSPVSRINTFSDSRSCLHSYLYAALCGSVPVHSLLCCTVDALGHFFRGRCFISCPTSPLLLHV
jgi:hypothetical protein